MSSSRARRSESILTSPVRSEGAFMRIGLALLMFVLVGGARESSAAAGGAAPSTAPTVAVVDLKFGPEISAADRAVVRAALDHALERAGLALVSQTEIQHSERSAPELFGCLLEDRCRYDLGRRLRASLLLSGSISREDSAWEIALALFNVDVGAVGAQGQRVCTRCSVQSVGKPAGELVAELVRTNNARPRGTLVVRTKPPGIAVSVDDRPAGATDLEIPVFAGIHRLSIGAHLSTTVEVQPGQRKDAEFKIEPSPTPPRPTPPTPPTPPPTPPKPWVAAKWRIGVAATLGVIGLGLVGFGAKFLADDGKGLCTLSPPQRQCAEVANTTGIGAGLVAGGAALAAAGAAWLIHDLVVRPRRDRRALTLVPTISTEIVGAVVGGTL